MRCWCRYVEILVWIELRVWLNWIAIICFHKTNRSTQIYQNFYHIKKLGDKFRAALKARILLYEDISHRALVPGHEIIGHVELKLGDWDKAALHFNAAKEICEGHLKLLDEEGGGGDEMEDRDLLIRIVERVNEGLSTVEVGRRSGTEIPGEMDMGIVDSIVEDLTRYDQLNDMQSKGNRSRAGLEIESIAEGEEEEEGEGGGGAIVDKLPTLDEKPKGGKGGMKMSEHRLRMTYISKSQGELKSVAFLINMMFDCELLKQV